ncbi:hypothetical protein [Pareuzebyella sediminis]|uniref:hypothetical protein n=1 Tax=Pareuzebyella sediminis TaxID=2607998 RepID=UPI0011EE7874|nr:hypothetical protein [Pareuzebyella sediminis]
MKWISVLLNDPLYSSAAAARHRSFEGVKTLPLLKPSLVPQHHVGGADISTITSVSKWPSLL